LFDIFLAKQILTKEPKQETIILKDNNKIEIDYPSTDYQFYSVINALPNLLRERVVRYNNFTKRQVVILEIKKGNTKKWFLLSEQLSLKSK